LKKSALVLLVILMGLITLKSAFSDTFPQAMSTNVVLNINNCAVSIDTEDNNVDFTTNITSPLCDPFDNATNVTNSFAFSKSVTVLFVRNVTCGESDIENLTKTCINLFEDADYISNYTECKEGKARLEESYNNLHINWESSSSLATNKSNEVIECNTFLEQCRQEGVTRNTELNLCIQERQKAERERDEYKSQRWTFALISLLIGIAAHILWTKRGRLPRESFPEQERKVMSSPFQKQLEKDLTK